MANWCFNKLRFEGNQDDISEVMDFIKGKEDNKNELIDFKNLSPVPSELYNVRSPQYTDEERAIAKKNIEKYGYPDWYEFCVNEWGTNNNACYAVLGDDNAIDFQTAWSPPIPFLIKLSKMFPEVKLIMAYRDEYMWFNKTCEVKNGKVVDDVDNIVTYQIGTEEGIKLQQEMCGDITIDADGFDSCYFCENSDPELDVRMNESWAEFSPQERNQIEIVLAETEQEERREGFGNGGK